MNKQKRFAVVAVVLLMAASMVAGDIFSLRRAVKTYLEGEGYSVTVDADDEGSMTAENEGTFYFVSVFDTPLGDFLYVANGFYVGNQAETDLFGAVNHANASAVLARYYVNREDEVVACSAGHFVGSEEDIPTLWTAMLSDFAGGENIIYSDLLADVDTMAVDYPVWADTLVVDTVDITVE